MIARLAPAATALRIAGGVLTIIGTYLPWATFVLNDGAFPEKSTLNFFVDPLGVTGFRLHLLLLGLAIIVLTVLKVQPTGRMVRALGWGVVAVAVRRKKQSQELRCAGCGSLLAKLEAGKLNLQRGDLQASFDGRFHASIVCYRARCRKLSVVEAGG